LEYLSAADSGDYERAYRHFSDSLRGMLPFEEYRTGRTANNAKFGPVRHRGFTRTTVYRNPQGVEPGIYIALDMTARFKNVDRHCSYLILKHLPSGTFTIVREEESFMTHETEAAILRDGGKAKVEQLWGQLSESCPGARGLPT
jgi:hypothetical protein